MRFFVEIELTGADDAFYTKFNHRLTLIRFNQSLPRVPRFIRINRLPTPSSITGLSPPLAYSFFRFLPPPSLARLVDAARLWAA